MMRVTVLQRNEPWWSLLLVLLGLISPVPLHAGPLRTVIICSEYVKHLAVETLVTRRDLSRLPIVDRVTGHRITLELGERIGVGLRGAAYRVRDFEVEPGQVPRSSPQADARQTTVGLLGPEVTVSPEAASYAPLQPENLAEVREKGIPVVAKFPHTFRGVGLPVPRANYQTFREVEVYRTLLDQMDRLQQDPYYPADPYWEPGHLPTPPILGELVGRDLGRVTLKAELWGKSLKAIMEEYRPETPADLPAPMRRSLEALYDLAQASYNVVRLPERSLVRGALKRGETVLSLDINPTNLIWVSDPKLMKYLGLKRPGFVAFEFGEMLPNYFHRDRMSKAQYLDYVVDYVHASTADRASPPSPATGRDGGSPLLQTGPSPGGFYDMPAGGSQSDGQNRK